MKRAVWAAVSFAVALTGCMSAERPKSAAEELDAFVASVEARSEPQSPTPTSNRTDVVTLENGNRVTCEIKQLARGLLKVKTDSMDTVNIEWLEIVRIVSTDIFRVELGDGTVYFGSFDPPQGPRTMRIRTAIRTIDVRMARVVLIGPVKKSLFDRIDGYIQGGLSFTKASEVGTINAAVGLTYKGESNNISFSANTLHTYQQTGDSSQRSDLTIGQTHFFDHRWFAGAVGGFQRNEALGIDLRTFVSGGPGRALIRTNHSLWSVIAGLSVNREDGGDAAGVTNNLEGYFFSEFAIFDFTTPKTDLTTTLTFYPGISDQGRYRINFDTRLRKEIVSDFFVDLSLYFTYDNQPPSVEASTTDWWLIAALGYSW